MAKNFTNFSSNIFIWISPFPSISVLKEFVSSTIDEGFIVQDERLVEAPSSINVLGRTFPSAVGAAAQSLEAPGAADVRSTLTACGGVSALVPESGDPMGLESC